jgi:nucleoside-diphosphate-sugar epimerase
VERKAPHTRRRVARQINSNHINGDLSNLKVLVTGAAGSLGSKLVEALCDKGYVVRAFDLPTADFTRIEKLKRVEAFKGDVTNYNDVRGAVTGVDGIFHLASILPPLSERDRKVTKCVNVGGTENLLKAIEKENLGLRFVFVSSTSVYGITAQEQRPISESHTLNATDYYSESKIACENMIRQSDLVYSILRISGIYSTEFIEPPDEFPFEEDQCVEFIDRNDVVTALTSTFEREEACKKIFNVAGGKTWQMTGKQFVDRMYKALGFHIKAKYSQGYTWLNWYDTTWSQAVLDYQRTTFSDFLKKLKEIAKELS